MRELEILRRDKESRERELEVENNELKTEVSEQYIFNDLFSDAVLSNIKSLVFLATKLAHVIK